MTRLNRLIELARLVESLKRLSFARWVFRAGALGLLIAILTGVVEPRFGGLVLIFLSMEITLDVYQLFIRSEIALEERRQIKRPTGLTYAAAALIVKSGGQSARLWYFLLHDSAVAFVLTRLGVPPRDFYQKLTPRPNYDTWLLQAATRARADNRPLAPMDFFEVVQTTASLVAIWDSLGLTNLERQSVWQWQRRLAAEIAAQRRGFGLRLSSAGGLGRDWASGYTTSLRQFGADLTRQLGRVANQITLVNHKQERQVILEYLGRSDHHNIIIVGDEGIGKQRLVYALAGDFASGRAPDNLRYKHLFELDVGRVINAADEAEIDSRLMRILTEAESAGNIVLVIPDFQLLVGAATGQMGMINAAGLLTGFLQRPGIQIVGLTTPSAYYTYIKPNQALAPYLPAITVHEIGPADALIVVEDEVFRFERQSGKMFTYQALVRLVEIADRHVSDRPYPEKALTLLGDVAAALEASPVVTATVVERVLSRQLKVPLAAPQAGERQQLIDLESEIKKRIIGQTEAVKAVANALRRARSGLTSGRRPIGTFLFLGPTGVGKTEMAKTVAALYYQNERAIIRLDMTEYQSSDAIAKLVGDGQSPGLLTTPVADRPFSVILLDEIEKADPTVRNLFLQVLDDGRVTDGYGKTVDFTNAMVIATSNAGSDVIRRAVAEHQTGGHFKPDLLVYLQDKGIFPPEWLNRFDAVMVFVPLSEEQIRQVAHLQVAELTNQLHGHNIELNVANDVYDLLVEKGYDPEYGARPMRRAIQDLIENALAKEFLGHPTVGKRQVTLTRAMLT